MILIVYLKFASLETRNVCEPPLVALSLESPKSPFDAYPMFRFVCKCAKQKLAGAKENLNQIVKSIMII